MNMAVKKTSRRTKTKKPSKTRTPVAVKKPMTKSLIMTEIAANTGLPKKQISGVFEQLEILIERHLKKRSVRQFALPGLLKIEVKRKPATKARKGINPFTGEETVFKAKPARDVVKIRPLKKVKDMVV
jgi:nucleoid DNA-binding protein